MEPILPAKIKKYLKSQIEQALRENSDFSTRYNQKYSTETVKKIRLAFFNSLVDMFQNYERRV